MTVVTTGVTAGEQFSSTQKNTLWGSDETQDFQGTLGVSGTLNASGTFGMSGTETMSGTLSVSAAAVTAVATGCTRGKNALLKRGLTKITIPKDVWVAAATTQNLAVCSVPAKTRVVGVISDTTTAYAGLSGTIAIFIGKQSGGNEFILSHDVKTATVTKGLADADLGASLALATAIQGGDVLSWSAATSVYIRLTSGTGNIGSGTVTNLTTGSTDLYLITETYA